MNGLHDADKLSPPPAYIATGQHNEVEPTHGDASTTSLDQHNRQDPPGPAYIVRSPRHDIEDGHDKGGKVTVEEKRPKSDSRSGCCACPMFLFVAAALGIAIAALVVAVQARADINHQASIFANYAAGGVQANASAQAANDRASKALTGATQVGVAVGDLQQLQSDLQYLQKVLSGVNDTVNGLQKDISDLKKTGMD